MKCTRIYLKNVLQMYIGMKLSELDINIDNDKQFNLIAGSNGSGKTTLENALNPCHQELIRPNKKGLKILEFKVKKETYIIKHFYEPTSKGHTCKMFITKIDKNGVKTELNPNGTITTFNELISLHLGINNETMKLLHLGNDISNLVKMTPSERKKFISVFTKNADIFLSIYKKINSDFNIINKTLKNYSTKLDMLGKVDKVNIELQEIENKLSIINNQETKLNYSIINNNKIMKDLFNYEKMERLKIVEKQYKDNKSIMENLLTQFGNIISESVENLLKRKQLLSKELESNIKNKSVSEDIIKSCNTKLIDINNQIELMETKLDIIHNDIEYDTDIDSELEEIDEKINKYSNIYAKKDSFDISIDNLLQIKKYYDTQSENIENIISDIELDSLSEFDMKKDYNSMYVSIISDISNIDSKIEIRENEIDNINNLLNGFNCENKKCPLLKKFFSNGTNIRILQEDLDELRKTKEKLEKKQHELYNLNKLSAIANNIRIYSSSILNKIIKFIDIDSKCKSINVGSSKLYDNNKFNKLLDILNIIDEVDTLLKRKEYLSNLKNKIETYEYYNKILIDFKRNKKDILKDKEKAENTLDKVNDNISNLNNGINNLSYLIENKELFDSKDDIIKEYESLIRDKTEYDNILIQQEQLKNELNKTMVAKNHITKDRDKAIYKKKQIKELKKKKKTCEEVYKDLEMIRKATSTNKGIPLIYVTNFLNNTRLIANKMLSKYNTNIKFGKFSINEKEFNMPLIKNGMENSDVRNGSGGERAIAALAISLAIVEQINNKKFNILILDEMDATLDSDSKRHFLDILEKTLKKLKIKQVFLISHSGIFEEYPLNLILFKGADVSLRGDKSILFQY